MPVSAGQVVTRSRRYPVNVTSSRGRGFTRVVAHRTTSSRARCIDAPFLRLNSHCRAPILTNSAGADLGSSSSPGLITSDLLPPIERASKRGCRVHGAPTGDLKNDDSGGESLRHQQADAFAGFTELYKRDTIGIAGTRGACWGPLAGTSTKSVTLGCIFLHGQPSTVGEVLDWTAVASYDPERSTGSELHLQ